MRSKKKPVGGVRCWSTPVSARCGTRSARTPTAVIGSFRPLRPDTDLLRCFGATTKLAISGWRFAPARLSSAAAGR